MRILISEKTKIGSHFQMKGIKNYWKFTNLVTLHSSIILVELWYLKLQIIRVKLICTMKGRPEVRCEAFQTVFLARNLSMLSATSHTNGGRGELASYKLSYMVRVQEKGWYESSAMDNRNAQHLGVGFDVCCKH